MARWVGEDDGEDRAEDADRANEWRGDADADADDSDGFFLVLFFFTRPRSSSRVLGGRVQRFPIAAKVKKGEVATNLFQSIDLEGKNGGRK